MRRTHAGGESHVSLRLYTSCLVLITKTPQQNIVLIARSGNTSSDTRIFCGTMQGHSCRSCSGSVAVVAHKGLRRRPGRPPVADSRDGRIPGSVEKEAQIHSI